MGENLVHEMGRNSKLARRSGTFAAFVLAAVGASGAAAGEVTAAVAANAAEAVEAVAAAFERQSGHRVTTVAGSTGKLYAQILHGAPFDVFLAADRERPRLLVEQGMAPDSSRRTYAVGRLALWSPAPAMAAHVDTLRAGSFRRLAIANPDLAPYGAAARDTLRALGLWESLRERIVVGENVGQSFAMVASGNAELGFVALSSVRSPQGGRSGSHSGSYSGSHSGSHWEVPERLHQPIRQDAVLLARAVDNAAAWAFLRFLASPSAQDIMESYGFRVE